MGKAAHDTLALCNHAIDKLKKAGFKLVRVSDKTEATYLRLGDREAVLRVATHPHNGRNYGHDVIAAHLTFKGNAHDNFSVLRCNPDKVAVRIQIAVGQYILNTNEAKP